MLHHFRGHKNVRFYLLILLARMKLTGNSVFFVFFLGRLPVRLDTDHLPVWDGHCLWFGRKLQ